MTVVFRVKKAGPNSPGGSRRKGRDDVHTAALQSKLGLMLQPKMAYFFSALVKAFDTRCKCTEYSI